MSRRVSSRSAPPVATVAVLAAVAVAVIADPGNAYAVGHGDTISTAPPWAAYVTTVNKFLWSQTTETSCTGTIVADDWVLTAAHCVVTEDKKGNPTSTPIALSKFEIVLGRSDLSTSQGGQWSVDRLAIDPHWTPGHLTDDAALLHLRG